MRLFNTLGRKIEQFLPIEGKKVKFYACGPTVYNFAHIGNLRSYVFEDVLKRALIYAGYEVNHIMNITDVDDKTIKKSGAKKIELDKITKQYEDSFVSDIKKLNIVLPDKFTRATEYIGQMVTLVKGLLNKGFAYKTSDGSIYFSINKFKNYGKLSNLDKKNIRSGVKVNQDEYGKENPADFVLWKAWNEADGDIFWQTDLGKGRPGWHIECSAMSQSELGDTIDIHAGGVDLIFPHHENEIAQSEAASGKKFVRFWLHCEHLLVDNQKMSKSLNNYYTLSDIIERGFSPLDFRYLCLGAHYRSKLNFTWEGLEAARSARKRLATIVASLSHPEQSEGSRDSSPAVQNDRSDNKYQKEFRKKIFADLNTPEAIAVMWEMMRDEKVSNGEKISNLSEFDKIMGLDLLKKDQQKIPSEIAELVKKRQQARKKGDFELADEIREQIIDKGYKVEDSEDRTKLQYD